MALIVNQQYGDASFISLLTLANPPVQLIENMSGVYVTPDGSRWVSNGTQLVQLSPSTGAFNPAAPGPIGGTTPGSGAFTNITANGNLTFAGNARRIIGDTSAAARANRLLVQNSITDGGTTLGIIPNGTSVVSSAALYASSSDIDNTSALQFLIAGGVSGRLNSTVTGTGTLLPLELQINNVAAVAIDISRNVVFTPTTNVSIDGNLVFSGTSRRITGDFSNATRSARVAVQTTTANSPTEFGTLPSGTGDTSIVGTYNAADPGNAALMSFGITATQATISSTQFGTGTYQPINIFTSRNLRMTFATGGLVTPGADNAQDFGSAGFRWKEIFAANAIINTSNGNEKTSVRKLNEAELKASILLADEIGVYQWLDSIERKGVENARKHVGMTVQRAMEIMSDCGLEPFAYGFICYDQWDEKTSVSENIDGSFNDIVVPAGEQYGFRESHLQAFIMRGFHERLTRLENNFDVVSPTIDEPPQKAPDGMFKRMWDKAIPQALRKGK